MHELVYAGCTVTAFLCAWMLLRSYAINRSRLLLWSGICFAGLTANNLLLVLDRTVFADVDLSVARLTIALLSIAVLVGALVLEQEG